MEHSPGVPAHSPPFEVTPQVAQQAMADAILRGYLLPGGGFNPSLQNDAIGCAAVRVCADAMKRAVDALGDNSGNANYEYVCDQLERVQESAGRAILAFVNCRRQNILDADRDLADALPDTADLLKINVVPTPPEGGAA